MNEDLDRISNWLKKNKLLLNTKKTNCMILTKKHLSEIIIPVVKIENDIIERVSNVNYIGVNLDDKLTLKEQAVISTRNAAGKTNLLFRISKNLTFDTKKVIFNSIVLPAFQYCSTIYTGNNDNAI